MGRALATAVLLTTYRVFDTGSMTGVPVMPTSGLTFPPGLTSDVGVPDGTDVSPAVAPCAASNSEACHRVRHGEASASNAYTLSCCVATMTTLCCAPLTLRFGIHSGCA